MISLDTIVGQLAPHVCISCGSEGSVLCSSCIDEFHQQAPARCAGCFKLSRDSKVCKTCRSWLNLSHVYVASVYEGLYEQLIIAFKFENRQQAYMPIARIMSQRIEGIQLSDYVICPIPTAPNRIRQRGFDHTKLIAAEIAKITGLQNKSILKRTSNSRQLGSSRQKRINQMSKEFAVKTDVHEKVLVIDDVMTSGATLSAASKVIKDNGAKEVRALVFARQV